VYLALGRGGVGGRKKSTWLTGEYGATGQALETRMVHGGRSREVSLQVGSMNDAGVQVAWDEEANVLLEGVRAMREVGPSRRRLTCHPLHCKTCVHSVE
jgi:hypothetical protein